MNEKLLLGLVIAGGAVALFLVIKNGEKKPQPMALLGAEPNSTEQPPNSAYQVITYPLSIETLGKASG